MCSNRSNKRIAGDVIDKSTGLFASDDKAQLPNQELIKKKRTSIKICSNCKQEVGVGLNHKCSVAQASVNIVEHAKTTPAKQQDQDITTLLKNKIQEQDSFSGARLEPAWRPT